MASFLGCFTVNLGNSYSLHAEFFGAMWAIEQPFARNWCNLWLECDSILVVNAFKTNKGIPWHLQIGGTTV